ncbi:MAG: effector-associated domain EAD1-containing protein [Cyanobacteria bacterium P01_G01_bin.54]
MSPKADVLLITVNSNETKAVLAAFESAIGQPAEQVPLADRLYRNLGTINDTQVFHALSEMGSGGPGAMQQTVQKGIAALSPTAVIAIGIAFGMNEQKQQMGDILLSRQLCLYEPQRVGQERILRGDRSHVSTRLINFFEGIAQTSWQGAPVHSGLLLTGEKLLDNLDYRSQLLQLEPEAIGGEMEGAGLYVAGQDSQVDWIVIKAICDWGDGQKNHPDKDAHQRQAAQNAAEFLVYALQQASLKRQRREEEELPQKTGVSMTFQGPVTGVVGTLQGDMIINATPNVTASNPIQSASSIQWTGPKRAKLRKAILKIYRNIKELRRFIEDQFEDADEILDRIGGDNLETWAADLLQDAAAKEWIDELYTIFCATHPQHSTIQQLKVVLGDSTE